MHCNAFPVQEDICPVCNTLEVQEDPLPFLMLLISECPEIHTHVLVQEKFRALRVPCCRDLYLFHRLKIKVAWLFPSLIIISRFLVPPSAEQIFNRICIEMPFTIERFRFSSIDGDQAIPGHPFRLKLLPVIGHMYLRIEVAWLVAHIFSSINKGRPGAFLKSSTFDTRSGNALDEVLLSNQEDDKDRYD